MTNINDIMETIEEETKYIMVDGKPTTVRQVIDTILDEKKEKKRLLSEG